MKTIIANWKMNVGVRESVALARGTLLTLRGRKNIPELVICPPFVALSEVRKIVARSHAALGAQNMSWEDQGAFTGEISPRMFEELGVTHVILGHSERRHVLGETDEMIQKKVQKALEHNLVVILCVGETKAQRDAGEERDIVKEQLLKAFDGLRIKNAEKIFIAYEPVWAIGTGKVPSPTQAQEVHHELRLQLATFNAEAAEKVAILYGGSLKADNAKELLAMPDIDGGLVGGASLNTQEFLALCQACI